ncbi:hypothetical protein OMA37_004431 [Vibrio fluvialis]|nr:hypothetical protein [Vibrio fluvialis]
MAMFSNARTRLDNLVFDRLSDGRLLIDGRPISATFDQDSLMFNDGRGNMRVLTISALQAAELGIKPTKRSTLLWNGKTEHLAEPPIYESGLIKLVLV